MKMRFWARGSWSYRSMLLVAGCALAVGLWARTYNLGSPASRVFDETYFPTFAYNYLQGVPVFDLHPPLGKFVLAAGIALLGDTPRAWRFMPALFGCALLGLGAVLGWCYTKERVGALLLAAFLASETILVVYSRTGLLDGILLFFVLATLLTALRAERRGQVIWPAVLLGLSVAVKWAALGLVVPVGYVLWRKGVLKPFVGALWISVIVYVLVVYVGEIAGGTRDPWRAWIGVWEWHLYAVGGIALQVDHPWASPWWSWPLMLRPIIFFHEAHTVDRLLTIASIGNPVLWWSSTIAVVLSLGELVRRKVIARKPVADHPLAPVLLGYVALLLPWVTGTRVAFLYHYLPSYAFALLTLVYWLCRLWKYRPWMVVAFAGCVLVTALYFLPMTMGSPMSPESLLRRAWLESWLGG
jgi:dolichyl-phosphate-mannose--protein O-mannosyl transferase